MKFIFIIIIIVCGLSNDESDECELPESFIPPKNIDELFSGILRRGACDYFNGECKHDIDNCNPDLLEELNKDIHKLIKLGRARDFNVGKHIYNLPIEFGDEEDTFESTVDDLDVMLEAFFKDSDKEQDSIKKGKCNECDYPDEPDECELPESYISPKNIDDLFLGFLQGALNVLCDYPDEPGECELPESFIPPKNTNEPCSEFLRGVFERSAM